MLGWTKGLVMMMAILMAVGMLSAPAWGAPKKPQQILVALKHNLLIIGETRGDLDDFDSAVADARDELEQYIKRGGDAAALIERDPSGMTPLIAAAFEGYGDLVEVLIQQKIVRDHVDDVDAKGLTAWLYASLGLKQSLVICNPTIADNPYIFTPIKVVQLYYTKRADHTYDKARRLIAAAGAKGNMALVKSKWEALCQMQGMATRQSVEKAPDLLKWATEAGTRTIAGIVGARR